MSDMTRREFIKKAATGAASITILGGLGKSILAAEDTTLPWVMGNKYNYRFTVNDKFAGTSSFVITKSTLMKKRIYLIQSDFFLEPVVMGQKRRTVVSSSKLYTELSGKPILYQFEANVNKQKQLLECRYKRDKIFYKARIGKTNLAKNIPISEDMLNIDNNMIGQWAFAIGMMDKETLKKKTTLHAFVPQALCMATLVVEYKKEVPFRIGSRGYNCSMYDIHPIGESCLVNDEGKLVAIQKPAQNLTITLDA